MKKGSVIINVILLVGMGYLFYLHFATSSTTNDSHTTDSNTETGTVNSDSPFSKVAYVNVDSLINKYELYNDLMAESKKERDVLEQQIKAKVDNLQREYEKAQQKATYMTQAELQQTQQNLQQKEINIQNLQQTAANSLMEKEKEFIKTFYYNVEGYLMVHSEKNDIDLIFYYQPGAPTFFSEKARDITSDVVAALNESYKAQKQEAENTGE